jgi:2-keto-3-deoxy-L-fuconate dehydrogenase
MRLRGKSAFVTGAAQGLGRAVVERFIAEGATVLACDLNEPVLRDAIRLPAVQLAVASVADPSAMKTIADAHRDVNVIVNCAGVVESGSILDCTAQSWQRSIDINVTGMFNVVKAFLPTMLERGSGTIINVASAVSSERAAKLRCAYGVSKGAVIALTKSIAMDYVDKGIRCNAISPGVMDSPSLRERIDTATDPRAALASFLKRQPTGRFGTTEEVAAVVVMLASDEVPFLTGANLIVDGGFSL